MHLMRRTLSVLLFCSIGALAADPMVGSWKVNLEKSKIQDPRIYIDFAVIIEPADNGEYRLTIQSTGPDGNARKATSPITFDGRENPRNDDPGVTVVYRRIDQGSVKSIFRYQGKEIETSVTKVSADGHA